MGTGQLRPGPLGSGGGVRIWTQAHLCPLVSPVLEAWGGPWRVGAPLEGGGSDAGPAVPWGPGRDGWPAAGAAVGRAWREGPWEPQPGAWWARDGHACVPVYVCVGGRPGTRNCASRRCARSLSGVKEDPGVWKGLWVPWGRCEAGGLPCQAEHGAGGLRAGPGGAQSRGRCGGAWGFGIRGSGLCGASPGHWHGLGFLGCLGFSGPHTASGGETEAQRTGHHAQSHNLGAADPSTLQPVAGLRPRAEEGGGGTCAQGRVGGGEGRLPPGLAGTRLWGQPGAGQAPSTAPRAPPGPSPPLLRAAQKLSLASKRKKPHPPPAPAARSASPYPTDFSGVLQLWPPPTPPCLLRAASKVKDSPGSTGKVDPPLMWG